MAAIDKTYVNNWKDYCDIVEWAKNKVYVCPNGTKLHVKNDCYDGWTEESFKDGKFLPVLNTSHSMDYFLIKDCPFEVVQETMKFAYGDEFYNSVKNGTSGYDLFTKEGKQGSGRLKRLYRHRFSNTNFPYPFRNRNGYKFKSKFSVEVHMPSTDGRRYGTTLWYSDKIDNFLWNDELGEWTCNCVHCCRSIKALVRKIRKWKLPKGAIVTARGRWIGEIWEFVVK